jgi:hypothetical protein
MRKELALAPLFEQFIRDSRNGKRLKPDGGRIKPQTIQNYKYVQDLLLEYAWKKGIDLRIRPINKLSQRELKVEMNYWKNFYRHFSDFLCKERGCYDNYIGTVSSPKFRPLQVRVNKG